MLQLSLAPARSWKGLVVHPLLTVGDAPLGYELLEDAVAAGTLRVTEIGEGTVPALLATNDGFRDVLILDGQQFLGACQNRTASRSILIRAGTAAKIPVSCMEQGRWRRTSDAFRPSDYHSPSKVRRHARRVETARAAADRPADPESLAAAQDAVWCEIGRRAEELDAHSGTGALDEVTRHRDGEVRDGIAHFPALPGQVGVLAFDGPEPLGLDAVHDRTLWARLHARIVGGYVQDALGRPVPEEGPDPEAAESFLGAVRGAARSEAPTVGGGIYRVLTGGVSGGELVDGERTVHLSAFPLEA